MTHPTDVRVILTVCSAVVSRHLGQISESSYFKGLLAMSGSRFFCLVPPGDYPFVSELLPHAAHDLSLC